VVPVERTRRPTGSPTVELLEPVRPGQHVRRRAEELAAGQVVLESGVRIAAPQIAALASVGCTRPEVYRAPRVAVLSTGDEIVEPDRPVAPHQVRNSNAHALRAQLHEIGAGARYLGIAGDERPTLRRVLETGLAGDALLITGGVSVGEYDLVAETLSALGARTVFHRVAVRPGQPLLFARREGCSIFGLPGNPVSTFATFVVFVAPALRRMLGLRQFAGVEQHATLDQALDAAPGRKTYHLARLRAGAGGLRARPVRAAGSGDVLALSRANGFLVTPGAGAKLQAGDAVRVLAWGEIDPG
jgi:molybdopterin molybdotransferase